MKIQQILKVFAIVLMAAGLLALASWVNAIWTKVIGSFGGLLPAGNEPIAVTIRGFLPTLNSAGTVIVLVAVGILGWSFGRRIWTA